MRSEQFMIITSSSYLVEQFIAEGFAYSFPRDKPVNYKLLASRVIQSKYVFK
jgi:hypothetical protein